MWAMRRAESHVFAYRQTAVAQQLRQPLHVMPAGRAYIPLFTLECTLRRSLGHDLCGVHCLAMPPNTGKTTVVKHVANKLVEENRMCGNMYVELRDGMTPSRAMAEALNVPHAKLYRHLDVAATRAFKPAVIIVDNADALLQTRGAVGDIVSMACASYATKSFIVIMLFSRAMVADVVCGWNGGAKVHPVPRLRPCDRFCVVPAHANILDALHAERLELLPSARSVLRSMALEAQSMGFVTDAVHLLRQLDTSRIDGRHVAELLSPDLEVAKAHWDTWSKTRSRTVGHWPCVG